MIWVVLAAGILIAASILATLMWHPEKNISREGFAHWIESLIRYYEDSASLEITSNSSPVMFRFLRANTKNDGCKLIFEVALNPISSTHQPDLIRKFQEQGYETDHIASGDSQEEGPRLIVEMDILDIWSVGAGNRPARLAHTVLDVIEMGNSEKFNLAFDGQRSRARTLEARTRLDPRSLKG